MKEVLACQYSVSDGMEIYASREQAASQILETSSNSDLPFDPIVKCYSLNYTDLVTPMCTYDLDVLRKLIPQTLDTPDYSVLKHFSEIYFWRGMKNYMLLSLATRLLILFLQMKLKNLFTVLPSTLAPPLLSGISMI